MSTAVEIRRKLGHPVIDGDAHLLEVGPVVLDFLKQVGGPDIVSRYRDLRKHSVYHDTRTIWWGAPTGPYTSDRAAASLPKLFQARMEEAGLDFAFVFTTMSIPGLHIRDDEIRQALCRALNLMTAEIFKDVRASIVPCAVIPMHTPDEALAEMDYAFGELGHKAAKIGTETRLAIPEVEQASAELGRLSERVYSVAFEARFDYDPVWQKFVDYGVAPACHTGARGGNGHRASAENYVFNHLGCFAVGSEFFARSLFMGYYARMASREGLLGLVTTGTPSGAVVPTFARVPVLGTNPIAFAAPARRNADFVLDMATSTASIGKISIARRNGSPLPEGWALDEDARPTTDAELASAVRRLTPLGGTRELGSHKGYGLAMMVDILGSILSGASIPGVLAHRGEKPSKSNVGHFFAAIDPEHLCGKESFLDEMDALIDTLHDTPRADETQPVLVAGDLEHAAYEKRLREGIPLGTCLIEELSAVASDAGVSFVLSGAA